MSKVLLALEGLMNVEPPVLVMVKLLLKLADKSMVTDSRVPQAGLNWVSPNGWLQSVAPETELVKDIESALTVPKIPMAILAATNHFINVFVFIFILDCL